MGRPHRQGLEHGPAALCAIAARGESATLAGGVGVLLMLANTYGLIPPPLVALLNTVSRACLVAAIAALGVKTSLQALAQLGWRPVAMLVGETLWIAVFVLAGVFILR